jgi:hypothetical protein
MLGVFICWSRQYFSSPKGSQVNDTLKTESQLRDFSPCSSISEKNRTSPINRILENNNEKENKTPGHKFLELLLNWKGEVNTKTTQLTINLIAASSGI